jgi:hypothetical protein
MTVEEGTGEEYNSRRRDWSGMTVGEGTGGE